MIGAELKISWGEQALKKMLEQMVNLRRSLLEVRGSSPSFNIYIFLNNDHMTYHRYCQKISSMESRGRGIRVINKKMDVRKEAKRMRATTCFHISISIYKYIKRRA